MKTERSLFYRSGTITKLNIMFRFRFIQNNLFLVYIKKKNKKLMRL